MSAVAQREAYMLGNVAIALREIADRLGDKRLIARDKREALQQIRSYADLLDQMALPDTRVILRGDVGTGKG